MTLSRVSTTQASIIIITGDRLNVVQGTLSRVSTTRDSAITKSTIQLSSRDRTSLIASTYSGRRLSNIPTTLVA
jgi:hypothetical protein